MSKKKSKKFKETNTGKVLLFLAKTPVYAYRGINKLKNFSEEKIEEKRVEKKRELIGSKYEAFKILYSEKGDYSKWEKDIHDSDSRIGVLLGARGTGKTAFGIKFLENVYAKKKKRCYAMGFTREEMPLWINVVENINELKNDSFVLIDEGGILFSSRNFMSSANKLLGELMLIARHKNLSILFISQNCLPINQKILTPSGIKNLKELKVRDLVYAFDFKKNKLVPAICKKSSKIKKKIVKIHLEDGRILKSSRDHKWIVYNEKGLSQKRAKDLNNLKDYLVDVSSFKEKL